MFALGRMLLLDSVWCAGVLLFRCRSGSCWVVPPLVIPVECPVMNVGGMAEYLSGRGGWSGLVGVFFGVNRLKLSCWTWGGSGHAMWVWGDMWVVWLTFISWGGQFLMSRMRNLMLVVRLIVAGVGADWCGLVCVANSLNCGCCRCKLVRSVVSVDPSEGGN